MITNSPTTPYKKLQAQQGVLIFSYLCTMDTYPNWSDADHSQWLNTGIKDYYKAAMMEFMRRWGMEKTIDIECEVVETKQLEQ